MVVFSLRDHDFNALIQAHPLLKRSRKFRPEGLYDSQSEVRALVEFCARNQVATITDEAQKDLVAYRITSEEADTALILALQVIFDKEHRPFSQLVKEMWSGIGDVGQTLLLRVAALHRFGSGFTPRLYTLLSTFPAHRRASVLDEYQICTQKRILFEQMQDEEPCVSTLHSLVAEHLVKASGKPLGEVDDELLGLTQHMGRIDRDVDIVRSVLRRVTDYQIHLSSEEKTEALFRTAAKATDNDWVVCQQFAKYLVQRVQHEDALAWADLAIQKNPEHAPLYHTKGNVLRHWGMELTTKGDSDGAQSKFSQARHLFATSRIRREPDEYGFVTHLDMLIYIISRTTNDVARASLVAEGVELYRRGIQAVPQDRFNLLLDDRFRSQFDLNGAATDELCRKIEIAAAHQRASDQAVAFLARRLNEGGDYPRAIAVLQAQRPQSPTPVFLWVKEAELHARNGEYLKASAAIDSAKRRGKEAEDPEIQWMLMYWELLIALALQDYSLAREASGRLAAANLAVSGQQFPRGYFWRHEARGVEPSKRILMQHARVWGGRIENLRSGGPYGEIRMSNAAGDTFFIGFNQRYFGRQDLRRGDFVKFVIAFLASRVRAEAVSGKPFVKTVDDLYLAQP